MSHNELGYLKSLFNKCKIHRKKRATENKRKRKEYRSLTAAERKVFHDAVRALKAKSVREICLFHLFLKCDIYFVYLQLYLFTELHFKT